MDAISSPFVLPKLRTPAARARFIPRADLIRLALEKDASLILVCAPAGYGKTTFLTEWAQSMLKSGTTVAWYALDPGDDAPITFGSYLVASFIQALGPMPDLTQLVQRLRASPEMDLQRILPILINVITASGKACALILDDYHLISSPGIQSAVAYLLEHRPDNLHMAIGSRLYPLLPLARLRARGHLLEIRADQLRFSSLETARFLNEIMRLDLPADGITALEERTEGWAAGLQLAALAMQALLASSGLTEKERVSAKEHFTLSFAGNHRYLVEYLLEEVVNSLPETMQAFLLSTSILERMNAPLCDALVSASRMGIRTSDEVSNSQSILKYLEQANLFIIGLDDQGCWYRYHHLFRNFLQAQLAKVLPNQIPALHRAACEWLAAHGFLREAARHAFQTRDWEYAAAFVEQHSFTLIIHSDISTIYEWCSAFPEDVMRKHPMLCIHQCWALAFSFQRKHRSRVEARLQQVEQTAAAMENQQQAADLRETSAVLRTFLSMTPDPAADPRLELELAQARLAGLDENNAGRFSALLTTGYAYLALHEAQAAYQAFETARQTALHAHLYFGIVESTFHLARLTHSLGQLNRTVDICQQGKADIAAVFAQDGQPQAEQQLPALGCLDIMLGCVMLERDQMDEADQHLQHGLELIGWGTNPYYLMTAFTALFRLREIQGRSEEALKYLDQLESTWPDITFCTRGLQVTHALRLNAKDARVLAEAADWAESFSAALGDPALPPGMGPFGAAEVYYMADLAWMRVQIATGRPGLARPRLHALLALAEAHGLTQRVIELTLLDAEISQVEGSAARAAERIERALRLSQPEGFIHIFNQGPVVTQLLVEAAHRGVCPAYARSILAAAGHRQAAGAAAPAAAAPAAVYQTAQIPGQDYIEPLSERELDVLRLIANGASNQVIAATLVITIGTVKSHINHILGKLDAHNRTQAAAKARELGLL